jgi:hypothetical protein
VWKARELTQAQNAYEINDSVFGRSAPHPRPSLGILQGIIVMTVSVASKLIDGHGGLSELGALVLGFIDGGTEWLKWAASAASANYDIPSETAMLAQVQQKLHGSSATLLPTLQLMVSPVRLMTLSPTELRAMAKAESGDTGTSINPILSAHGLMTQQDLDAVPAFLASLGVGGAALFQCLGLNDMINLAGLTASPQPGAGEPGLQRDAARFALQQARTPEEFGDYYRAYLALKAKLNAGGSTPEQDGARASAAVQTLQPPILAALDSPRVDGLVPPSEVATAVSAWLRQGRRLGFSRLSEGIRQIIDNTTFTTETGTAAQQVVDLYLANAQSFLSANPPTTGQISQDGRSCVLPAQSGNLFAELMQNPGGIITLRQFRRIPPPGA